MGIGNSASPVHGAERIDSLLVDNFLGKIFAFAFAFVFVLLALSASLYAAVQGAEWFAAIFGGGTIASVVWAFVKTNSNNGRGSE